MQQDAHKRALIAGSIGNFIEWYEFAVYGFLATVIARNFFQLEGEAELTSLILTWASFAIAFFFRPLGAVVFGRIGDRIGRKPTLIIVLVLMTLATAAIGIVPVYASIGIAAPLIATTGVSPELMVIAVGSGSVIFSHVNDPGFWLFKEYFNLTIGETIKSWSVLETIISVCGLVGCLLLGMVV